MSNLFGNYPVWIIGIIFFVLPHTRHEGLSQRGLPKAFGSRANTATGVLPKLRRQRRRRSLFLLQLEIAKRKKSNTYLVPG